MSTGVGRNDPCPCGSGKKYKTCCLGDKQAGTLALHRLRRIQGELVRDLLQFAKEVYGDEQEAWALGVEDDRPEWDEDVWDQVGWGDEGESRAAAPDDPEAAILAAARRRARSTVSDSGDLRSSSRGGCVSRLPSELHEETPEVARISWRNWPDQQLPGLHDQTLREAVTTPRGRERVEVLLRSCEWAFEFEPDVPFVPDLAGLRRQLGLL